MVAPIAPTLGWVIRAPKHPCLRILGPRGKGTDEMTLRVPPHFGAQSLSPRLSPGQSWHSTLCSCCAAGPGFGHWEWTRKYQWALLGLITHRKGMTSISLDFLGTCLQLEHLGPRSHLQHREAAEQWPGAGEEK